MHFPELSNNVDWGPVRCDLRSACWHRFWFHAHFRQRLLAVVVEGTPYPPADPNAPLTENQFILEGCIKDVLSLGPDPDDGDVDEVVETTEEASTRISPLVTLAPPPAHRQMEQRLWIAIALVLLQRCAPQDKLVIHLLDAQTLIAELSPALEIDQPLLRCSLVTGDVGVSVWQGREKLRDWIIAAFLAFPALNGPGFSKILLVLYCVFWTQEDGSLISRCIQRQRLTCNSKRGVFYNQQTTLGVLKLTTKQSSPVYADSINRQIIETVLMQFS